MEKPTFATGTTADDLKIDALQIALPGDSVFLSIGEYADKAAVDAAFADQAAIATLLGASFVELGEVAEGEAVKPESKTESLKTRHYSEPGKRTTSISLTLAGLGSAQKDFLESSAFEGKAATIVFQNPDKDRVCVLNGLRWSADWTGSDTSVTTITLKTEFGGLTKDKVVLIRDIPEGA